MSMNITPYAERLTIAFFGIRNAGKSSLVNSITNQQMALVSDIKGTTTDPVFKAMELLPLGPVNIIDTAGIDDEGKLGELRVQKTIDVLNKTDIAILVSDAKYGLNDFDKKLIDIFKTQNIKYIIAYNKADLLQDIPQQTENEIFVSALNNININELKDLIGTFAKTNKKEKTLLKDIVNKNDVVVLVTPIDESAPKGRLILPQQQVIRELLEVGAITIVVQVDELNGTLQKLSQKPKLVITDSQVFKKVNEILPNDIYLTSFSILFARYKGILSYSLLGVEKIKKLQDGDTILISEGCTHHRQCEDIGSVKIPKWLQEYTGKKLKFEFSSGNSFSDDISKYSMIIHCGACMLKDIEVLNRYIMANKNNIPISNYGITIAYMNNILQRSVEVFK